VRQFDCENFVELGDKFTSPDKNHHKYLCCGMDKGQIIFLDLLSNHVQQLYARYSIVTKPITLI
jgi:hypothetical protein